MMQLALSAPYFPWANTSVPVRTIARVKMANAIFFISSRFLYFYYWY